MKACALFSALLSVLFAVRVATAAEFHVSPHGDDTAVGSAAQPWRTPAHAVRQLRAGDTLLFADGTYPLTAPLIIKKGEGAADRWTVLASAPGANPVLDATGQSWPGGLGQGENGMLQIRESTHVRLIGLTVRNSPGGGISAHAPCAHLDLLGVRVDGSHHFGLGLWDVRQVRVLGCEIQRANSGQQRNAGRDTSAQEALSLGNVQDFEVAWNHVHHGGKEGIDIKRPSQRGRVHHNYVHHLRRQGIYLDARRVGTLRDVEVDHNVVHDCEWGLAFSSEQKTATTEDVSAHHNVLHANRASGIILAPWVQDGPRQRLRLTHNTLVGNGGATGHWSGSTGNLDVRTTNLRDIVIEANLCVGGGHFDIATIFPPADGPANLARAGITIRGNRAAPDATWQETVAGQFPRPYPFAGEAATQAQPAFADAAGGDFRLRPETPAALHGLGAFAPGDADWATAVRAQAGHYVSSMLSAPTAHRP